MARNHKEAQSAAGCDEAVARRLGHAFEGFEAGECLDPEQIAAYEQRALAPEEIARCEGHLAACSRCREILQLVAATDVPFTMSEAAAREAAAKARPAPRASWWRSVWLVPAFAATAAVALFFVVHMSSHSSERATSALTAEAPSQEQVSPPPESLTGPQLEVPSAPAAPDSGSGSVPAAKSAVPSGAPQAAVPQAPLEAENYAAAAKPEVAAPPSAGTGVAQSAPPSGAPAPSPAPPPSSSYADSASELTRTPAPNATPNTKQNAGTSAASAEPAPAASPAMRAARAPSSQSAASASAPAPASTPSARQAAPAAAFGALSRQFAPAQLPAFFLSVTSPSSAISWRAGAGGAIQRSSDGGRTWQSQPSPLAEDWLAGSAASDTVCWLVGRNGAIARTVDGQRWQRIPAPDAAAGVSGKQPDWLTVMATDADTVVITSASQAYITHNAGRSWQELASRQLQP